MTSKGYWVLILVAVSSMSPAAPVRLTARCSTAMVVGLEWTKSSAKDRVAGYSVARDGELIATLPGAQSDYADMSVAPSTDYSYVVTAIDLAGSPVTSSALAVHTAAAASSGDAPYCPSTIITAAAFDFANAYSDAHAGSAGDQPPSSTGSDLWPVTWGADGRVYAIYGDGWGLCGQLDVDADNRAVAADKTSLGIARIAGPPRRGAVCAPQFAHGNIYGGYRSSHPYAGGRGGLLNGKATGIFAIGSSFYAIAGIWRSGEAGRFNAPNHEEIAYSRGNGYSWHDNGVWDFCSLSADKVLGGAFSVCPTGFLQFGKGNRGARDRFVYLYAVDAAAFWDLPAAAAGTFLLRVPRDQLLIRSAYRYYCGVGFDGQPLWSDDRNRRQAIFVDRNPNRVGTVSGENYSFPMGMTIGEAVYDAPLRRYLATAQGERMGQAALYEAPNPWGPWSVIFYANIDPQNGGQGGWGNLGSGTWNAAAHAFAKQDTLGIHIVNAWTRDRGRVLYMAFSSSGLAPADAWFTDLAGNWMDSFNLVKSVLTVK